MRGKTAISRPFFLSPWFVAWVLGCILFASGYGNPAQDQARGLPFIRSYPLDEIGNVPRGLRLGFDEFGRLAVMYDGIYAVLNDSAWLDRIGTSASKEMRMTTIAVSNGQHYYGGRSSWGKVAITPEGHLKPHPLVPQNAPEWTRVTAFNNVLPTSKGVYFYELNGAVYWDFARQENSFYPMPRLAALFMVGERVFVSSDDCLLREILPEQGTSRIAAATGLEGQVVSFAAPLDPSHTLLVLRTGQLMSFDGNTAVPWTPDGPPIDGRITAIARLAGGGVAIAIADKGLRLWAPDGSLLWALDLPELGNTRSIASGEPGVLWAAGGNAVHRIFYDSPQTSFGTALGINAIWPAVGRWDGTTVICSGSSLFKIDAAPAGHVSPIRTIVDRGLLTTPTIATSGSHLLGGNATGVFSIGSNGQTTPIISIESVGALSFITPDVCIVMGSVEIAALKYADGRWTECARRIQGVGDAPIRVESYPSPREPYNVLWAELGGDQVARLTFRDGEIHFQRIPLPWTGGQWANIGRIDNTIIISSGTGQRTYFDEDKGTPCAAPQLDELLGRSRYWLIHMTQDASGTIWASHSQGVVTFTPSANDYLIDSTTFELRNDSYPAVRILPGDDIWITAGRSLYHVEQRPLHQKKEPPLTLVSLIADKQTHELLRPHQPLARHPTFTFDDNSLTFRFFSGTYAWMNPPQYQYRLGPSEQWRPVDPSMVLSFPRLQDGAYRLEVRRTGSSNTGEVPFTFAFTISPPWYRTPASYAAYALAGLLALVAVARWMNHRSLQQNAKLERLVQERTMELKAAMEKLGEETRHAATLAERSRLAGEIHDSLQQGLSGSILMLDTTMTSTELPSAIREQLNLMRGMLSYSREEVQQAVWDLASPFLQNATLGDALRKITSYINSGSAKIDIGITSEPVALDSKIQHHLLRIAQEAITNAVKHAAAQHIDVTLQSDDSALVLSVRDDGRGFDPKACANLQGHFGLRGLSTRAKAIHAQLQITSTPGAGSIVRVSIPLHATSSHDPSRQAQ